ncbi:Protein kinase domain-containing protein [Plasmodiophora brassicae]|uniref:Protein kinase domain-containing protein n=1 Tax=Plasmodiophora brassicae TaxID=37360 RepID=A0A0G4II57_PLABS|nr:hypothetical protein PBRA_003580 [Plasmodiophora brassicae]
MQETRPVPDALGVDVGRLVAYLVDQGVISQERSSSPSLTQFVHGQSNPTYLLVTGAGAELVIRRKPPGKLLQSAHAVEREYRIMKALQGSNVPVPNVLHLCTDPSVIGSVFFVMEYVRGRIFKDPALPTLSRDSRFAVYADLLRVLCNLHSFDYRAAGLSDFGPDPTTYMRRQVHTWTRQYQASKTSEIPDVDELINILNDKLPQRSDESECSIVHGDFRLDNCILHPTEDRIIAILDWELCTLGPSICDISYLCLMYHMPKSPFVPSIQGRWGPQYGIPSESDLLYAYLRLTGRPFDQQLFNACSALACFRLAAICQGVLKRSIQGNASSAHATTVGELCPVLARLGIAVGRRTTMLATEQRKDHLPPQLEPFRKCFSSRFFELRSRLLQFMDEVIYPAEAVYERQQQGSTDRWSVPPVMETLKAEARKRGLWNLFLTIKNDRNPQPLTNVEYAPLCEIMGRSILLAPEACNSSAPDTGNMELLALYGTPEQKSQWLEPLLNGSIRSCFGMTEPHVASSDATQVHCSIRKEGDSWVLNGSKWWTSGAMHPSCRLLIVMGKTEPLHTDRWKQQSIVLVPIDTPGVHVVRHLSVFGYDDAPEGHAEIRLVNVRVPLSSLIGRVGQGFEISQARLGPGRIHHCMRAIGAGERALELMCRRAKVRSAFGKRFSAMDAVQQDIASCRIEIDQCRSLILTAASVMDANGNKSARHLLAEVKVTVPTSILNVVDRAIQLHGAAGVSQDTVLARLWAALRCLRIADGPDAVHRVAIGKQELLQCRL